MRPYGSPKTWEKRRCRARALLAPGLNVSEVARRVQASVGSVHPWQQMWAHGGEAALVAKPAPGRPRKRTGQQGEPVRHLVRQGARAYGFPNALWTLKRIATVRWRECGVHYPPSHVWQVLRRWHWSYQVPERHAIQRDEPAIVPCKRSKWPAIKKSPQTWRSSRVPRRERLAAPPHAVSNLGTCGPDADPLLQRQT